MPNTIQTGPDDNGAGNVKSIYKDTFEGFPDKPKAPFRIDPTTTKTGPKSIKAANRSGAKANFVKTRSANGSTKVSPTDSIGRSKVMSPRGGRGTRGSQSDNDDTPRRSTWFAGNSPLTVATLGITLALNFAQIGFTYAHVLARLDANQLAISNADQQSKDRDASQAKLIDDRHIIALQKVDERYNLLLKQIDRFETTMNSMSQLRTDVEVMKNKLTGIDDTLRRVEKSWDRDRDRPAPGNGNGKQSQNR